VPELRRLQAELSARHSYREGSKAAGHAFALRATQLCDDGNRAHRVAAEIENQVAAPPKIDTEPKLEPDMIVLIDGAYIRAAPDYQTRRIDVTVARIGRRTSEPKISR
jgi:hypothetical protein